MHVTLVIVAFHLRHPANHWPITRLPNQYATESKSPCWFLACEHEIQENKNEKFCWVPVPLYHALH